MPEASAPPPVQSDDEPIAGPTPRPWTYTPDFNEVQAEAGKRTLAKLDASEDYSRFAEETQANGRLMAAAPDLAEALAQLYGAMADLLDHATGQAEADDPTRTFDRAERTLAQAALALDAADVPGPSDEGVWGGSRAPEEDA